MGWAKRPDVVLLTVGYLALGGVVLQAGEALYQALITTLRARTLDDYDVAARHLAKAVSLLGVQVLLSILMQRKPKGTFRTRYWEQAPLKVTLKYQLPRNGRFFYRPKLSFIGNALGPVSVGGLVYQLYRGAYFNDP